MRILKAAGLYFLLTFAAGFALGAVRVTLLVPMLGERAAELIEAPFMLVVIVLAARHVVTRRVRDASAPALLAVGALALLLLLSVEFSVVIRLRGMTLDAYLAGRDPVAGGVYGLLLLVYAAMPLIAARRRANESSTIGHRH